MDHLAIHSLDSTASAVSKVTVPGQSIATPSFSAVLAEVAGMATGEGKATRLPAPQTSTVQQATVTTSAATTTPAAAAADDADDPAGPLFGANPWMTDPTGNGPGGSVTNYNPIYFATQQTAQTVAQMVGGTVVQSEQITSAPGSPFQQNQLNYMVQLPNGGLINPGLVADIYTHGWNDAFDNQQVANEVAGAEPAAAGTMVSSVTPQSANTVQQSSVTPTTATASDAAAADVTDPAGPLFGANPWLTDPTGSGPGGSVTDYNSIYFATQQTAQTVAQMVGGTVVQSNQITSAPGSPFQQDQPNYMVQLANGGLINPGLVADIYTHGWNQSLVDQQVANEVAGAAPAGASVSP